MKKFKEKVKSLIKKNRLLYIFTKAFVDILRFDFSFISRNKSILNLNQLSNSYKNIFILDTRIHHVIFDSVILLIRGSNFFYNDKWSIIIYEDKFLRSIPAEGIYLNSLVNIFLQSLLILPNPPISIKIVNNSYELIKIINKSKKFFPEDYNFFDNKKSYLAREFNEKDFQNLKINQPILKSTKYHLEIFQNYLDYRKINKYITITIRTKKWGSNDHWNTNLEDMKLYLDFIKKNNLNDYDILLLPDTQADVPKEIISFLKNNDLKYHLFYHGAYSIPLRFLAYSKSSFNLSSTNGPVALLLFIAANSFVIWKEKGQIQDYKYLTSRLNKDTFFKREFIFYEKFAPANI